MHQALERIGKKLEFVEPKSDRSRRVVSLPAFAIEALERHQTLQGQERLLAGSRSVDSGLVFTSTIGTALDERNVRRAFQSILKSTLGHSQISLTLDPYSHVLSWASE